MEKLTFCAVSKGIISSDDEVEFLYNHVKECAQCKAAVNGLLMILIRENEKQIPPFLKSFIKPLLKNAN